MNNLSSFNITPIITNIDIPSHLTSHQSKDFLIQRPSTQAIHSNLYQITNPSQDTHQGSSIKTQPIKSNISRLQKCVSVLLQEARTWSTTHLLNQSCTTQTTPATTTNTLPRSHVVVEVVTITTEFMLPSPLPLLAVAGVHANSNPRYIQRI